MDCPAILHIAAYWRHVARATPDASFYGHPASVHAGLCEYLASRETARPVVAMQVAA